MADHAQTRSEYLKIMLGERKNALSPYRPEQMNDLGDTSFDVASLSDDDIDSALKQMAGTQYENSELFKAIRSEREKRGGKEEGEKNGWQQFGDFFTNLGTSIFEGVLNVVDAVKDFGLGVVAGVGGGWFGQNSDFTDGIAKMMTDDSWMDFATEGAAKFMPTPMTMLTHIGDSDYWDDYWTWDLGSVRQRRERMYQGQEGVRSVGNFVGEIIPSLALAFATGGASAGAQMAIQGGFGFARSYGKSASQALSEGATFQQASAYGAMSGAVEGAFSAGSVAVGGLLAGKGSQGAVKTVSQNFGQLIGQRFGQGAQAVAGKSMEIILDALGEATEETVENMLDPAFRMVYDKEAWYNAYGTSENFGAYMQGVGKAALMAAAGSVVAGAFKEGVEIAGIRADGKSVSAEYASEIEKSRNFKRLQRLSKENGDNVAGDYIAGQRKYAALLKEDEDFQRRIDKITAKRDLDADALAKIASEVSDHQAKMAKKYSDWADRYGDVFQKAERVLGKADAGAAPRVDVSSIPTERVVNAEGTETTEYVPVFDSPESFKESLIAIRDEADGPYDVRLPLNEDVRIDVKSLTDEEIGRIAEIKPAEIKTSEDGSVKYADVSEGKILVVEGERTGIVAAEPNADGTGMVYKVGDEEVPAIGVDLPSSKQEVEAKYGKNASKAQPSLIIAAAEGKEGAVFSRTGAKDVVDTVEWYVKRIVDGAYADTGNEALDLIIQKLADVDYLSKNASLQGKTDLVDQFFAQLNLTSDADKAYVKDFLSSEIMGMDVKIKGRNGKYETHKLSDLLTTDELSMVQARLDDAFSELMANGRTSKYSKLLAKYESTVQRLLGDIDELRERAHLATEVASKFNALANKLGMNGKPSQIKTILGDASPEDVAIVDMFKGVVRDTKLSRTGLTTSPVAAERLLKFASEYTVEKYGNSYLWDDGIKMELDKLESYASDYSVKVKGEVQQRHGFHPYTELDIETQRCISNLLSAINKKLSSETKRVYMERKARASEGVSLYNAHQATRHTIVDSVVDSAESFASYAANYIGKENPVYDALVTDWTKANGTQLSRQFKYTEAADKILKEEGFNPNKGFKFLKKKVEFKGQRITKGEAASIYFSAKTKEGIKNGVNALTLYNQKTDSKSIVFRLEGDGDLLTLESLFTPSELKVMERLQKEVIGGVMKDDFVGWFEKRYGFKPDVSDDYFMLNADTAKARLNAERGQGGAGAMLNQTWGRARARQTYKGRYAIVDFANQFARYGNDLAHYIGYSDYIENARVLLQTKVEVGKDKVSLNELLNERAPNWAGKNGWERYFDYIATDSQMGDSLGFLGKIMRGGQTSVLGLNPRSMAKQLLSDFTVMGDVGIGTYLKSKKRVPYNISHYKQIRDFMINAGDLIDINDPSFAEYAPYFAIIRERFKNKGAIKGELSSDVTGKIADVALKGMSFFDEANNVVNVWAVAETMAHDFDGLKYGTQANKLQAMKYFTDLVFRTQSNSNKMYVSKLRAGFGEGGQLRKLLFGLFASDNQNKLQQVDAVTREFYQANKRKGEYQKIVDDVNSTPDQIDSARKAIAFIEKNYSKAAWGKKSSGVIAGLALSGLGAALINETFDRIVGKKDKDGEPKKLADGLNWADVMSKAPMEMFVNWIPYVSTIANSIQNNTDMSLMPIDRMNDLKDTAVNLFSALQGGDSSKIGKAVMAFVSTYGELAGIPIGNVYKYVKGIIRNANEAAYVKTFGWMDGLKSGNITESYKNLIARGDVSGAADVLGVNYAMYKTGNADRDALVEIAKLSQQGYNAVAKNVPEYVQDEQGGKAYLTDAQKSGFAKRYSDANARVAKLIRSASYRGMDGESKAKAIKKVYDLYYEAARYDALGIEPESKLGKLLAYATGFDDDLVAAILLIQRNAALQATSTQTRKQRAIKLVNGQPMTRVAKLLTLCLMGYGVSDENKKAVRNGLVRMGFTKAQADAFLP